MLPPCSNSLSELLPSTLSKQTTKVYKHYIIHVYWGESLTQMSSEIWFLQLKQYLRSQNINDVYCFPGGGGADFASRPSYKPSDRNVVNCCDGSISFWKRTVQFTEQCVLYVYMYKPIPIFVTQRSVTFYMKYTHTYGILLCNFCY